MHLRIQIQYIIFFLFFSLPLLTFGLTLPFPNHGDDIIGKIQKITLTKRINIDELCREYEVSYFELREANSGVKLERLRRGDRLVMPREYILPQAPRRGIVINLPELRLYYFLPKEHRVMTYPIGIGKEGEETPVMKTRVIQKKEKPVWRPTLKTRVDFLYDNGIPLPESIDPGKDNPLGDYMLRLANWIILIHGTQEPQGVGKFSSGGCIRMYPESIATLYPLVPVGTPVDIVRQPLKVGWRGNKLYLESHVPMENKFSRGKEDLQSLAALIKPKLKRGHVEVNWDKALHVANQQRGIPEMIGQRI